MANFLYPGADTFPGATTYPGVYSIDEQLILIELEDHPQQTDLIGLESQSALSGSESLSALQGRISGVIQP